MQTIVEWTAARETKHEAKVICFWWQRTPKLISPAWTNAMQDCRPNLSVTDTEPISHQTIKPER
jgi:hypothetical protein